MAERELIEPHKSDKRYVRRDAAGHFTDEVDLHRSLSEDDRRHATHKKPHNQGDRGD